MHVFLSEGRARGETGCGCVVCECYSVRPGAEGPELEAGLSSTGRPVRERLGVLGTPQCQPGGRGRRNMAQQGSTYTPCELRSLQCADSGCAVLGAARPLLSVSQGRWQEGATQVPLFLEDGP